MQIRWKLVLVVSVLFLGLSAFINRQTATAADPQATAAKKATAAASIPGGALSVPDTTVAINAPAPMSQRVVHYEIDAKYDANMHTVDATEVLTYHNLTGQALDHF